jgi:YbbR domain-containing protein
LQELADSQFLAEVDLQNATAGTNQYPVVHLDFGPSVHAPGVSFLPPRTVTVTIETKTQTPIPVTLQPTNLPPGQGIISQAISPDRVTMRGTKGDLNNVKKAVAIVDLSGVTPDREYTAKVDLEDAKGETVKGVDAVPDSVEVRPMLGPAMDQVKVPVSYSWRGSLRHGYTLRDVKLNPDVVVIKGKTSAIRRVSVVKTKPIDMTKITSDQVVSIDLVPPKGGVQMSVKSVNVRFYVTRPPVAPAPPKVDTKPSTPPLANPITPSITAH